MNHYYVIKLFAIPLSNYKITVPHETSINIYQITTYHHVYKIKLLLKKCALVHLRLSAIFIHMSAGFVFFS